MGEPWKVRSEQEKRERAETAAEEDEAVFRALDELEADPPCDVCGEVWTSEGAKKGCHHCIIRHVMIT